METTYCKKKSRKKGRTKQFSVLSDRSEALFLYKTIAFLMGHSVKWSLSRSLCLFNRTATTRGPEFRFSRQIRTILFGFGLFSLDLVGIGDHYIGLRGQNDRSQVRIGVFWPHFGHFEGILAIMLGFGPFCFDLGHIAQIQASW